LTHVSAEFGFVARHDVVRAIAAAAAAYCRATIIEPMHIFVQN
jgi:hypothetical protein